MLPGNTVELHRILSRRASGMSESDWNSGRLDAGHFFGGRAGSKRGVAPDYYDARPGRFNTIGGPTPFSFFPMLFSALDKLHLTPPLIRTPKKKKNARENHAAIWARALSPYSSPTEIFVGRFERDIINAVVCYNIGVHFNDNIKALHI